MTQSDTLDALVRALAERHGFDDYTVSQDPAGYSYEVSLRDDTVGAVASFEVDWKMLVSMRYERQALAEALDVYVRRARAQLVADVAEPLSFEEYETIARAEAQSRLTTPRAFQPPGYVSSVDLASELSPPPRPNDYEYRVRSYLQSRVPVGRTVFR